MTHQVGLTQYNALAVGGQGITAEAQHLRTQLNNLIADMEQDRNAMRGNQLAAFGKAKAELHARFGELLRWCQQHGISLTEGQNQVVAADASNEADFVTAGGNLSGLTRPMNL